MDLKLTKKDISALKVMTMMVSEGIEIKDLYAFIAKTERYQEKFSSNAKLNK